MRGKATIFRMGFELAHPSRGIPINAIDGILAKNDQALRERGERNGLVAEGKGKGFRPRIGLKNGRPAHGMARNAEEHPIVQLDTLQTERGLIEVNILPVFGIE